jgi:pimeloyl-ACP methyl ester carboxylesterase
MTRRIAVLLVCALAGGCGGDEPARPSVAKTPRAAPVIAGAGRVVDIGGGRTLFLNCTGSGSPALVLEAGLGGDSVSWQSVQPELGRTTRTCSYDRAGLGNSLALPGIHDARDEIGDLLRLLDSARIDPPYVLVGHSYGGLLVRLFAQAHPHEVAGMVLVDSMGRDQTRRTMAIWPRSQTPELRRSLARPVQDGVDLRSGEVQASRVRSLGDTPLAVITAGRETFGGVPKSFARTLDRLWLTMQDELAALSGDVVHVVALRSDHNVQTGEGQPDVVIRAVQAVVRAARERMRLGPCTRLFSGSGVRCRG